jgi:hypothetical protein
MDPLIVIRPFVVIAGLHSRESVYLHLLAKEGAAPLEVKPLIFFPRGGVHKREDFHDL